MIRELPHRPINGFVGLALCMGVLGGSVGAFSLGVAQAGAAGPDPAVVVPSVVAFVAALVMFAGLFTVQPNEAKVVTLFGRYVGTVKTPGFWYTNPLTTRREISLRVRNFETAKLKVNDVDCNPIEIGAVVVWRVVDTAEALFEVDAFERFVHTQAEAALRILASHYPYDPQGGERRALTTHQDEIAADLLAAVQARLSKAGVEVLEARISHLAYAPEIAAAMLQRQQASAVVAARQKIVEGAVGMVEQALELLQEKRVVALDEERTASMVSNLLVVLCSDRAAHPVVNAGTLHH